MEQSLEDEESQKQAAGVATSRMNMETSTQLELAMEVAPKCVPSKLPGKYVHPRARNGGTYSPPVRKDRGSSEKPEGEGTSMPNYDTGRPTLKLTNLPDQITEDNLKKLFAPLCKVYRIYMAVKKGTGERKNFAHVAFANKADAQKALDKLQGYAYEHCVLKLEWADSQKKNTPEINSRKSLGYEPRRTPASNIESRRAPPSSVELTGMRRTPPEDIPPPRVLARKGGQFRNGRTGRFDPVPSFEDPNFFQNEYNNKHWRRGPPPPRQIQQSHARLSRESSLSNSMDNLNLGPREPFEKPPREKLQELLKRNIGQQKERFPEGDSESSEERFYEDLMGHEEVGRNLSLHVEELEPEIEPVGGKLPIDVLEEEIIQHIQTHRITIIHGETGCGKSSRVPVMLYHSTPNARMFVAQPRRIAATALATRVRDVSGIDPSNIGLRLGHGVKDENPGCRIWFVTTGYLVRLLAHHPEAFESHTHLIIDEVHERSVDIDILCLLARRLLDTHTTIRLVLMSATLAADMYRKYFNVEEPALFVGTRRFPVHQYFAEDLGAISLTHATGSGKPPSNQISALQYTQAVQISRQVGYPGSSVLIFVSGMADIMELTERFEIAQRNTDTLIHYKCLPIHSDIPMEEQLEAFQPAGENEVKIIIATNAAESSVTLPDVDHVICLGTCKKIKYNLRTHRSLLAVSWISRASATQRIGRTGRVRPGSAYHLYSRALFEYGMSEFDEGEMHQQPLDAVILSLKSMLGGNITSILEDVIEPPESSHIARAFASLHESGLIDTPSDEGDMTKMGEFVAAMGIDLQMGRIIGLGSQFGVLPEAIVLAGALSMPRSPFRIANPLIHDDPDEYNTIVRENMIAQEKFDNGMYSTPIMLMQILWEYQSSRDPFRFCMNNSLAHTRMKQFMSTVSHLQSRVEGLLGRGNYSLVNEPATMTPKQLNLLRLLLVWVFHKQILMSKGLGLDKKKDVHEAPINALLKAEGGYTLEESCVSSLFGRMNGCRFESGKRVEYILQPFWCERPITFLHQHLWELVTRHGQRLACAWVVHEQKIESHSGRKRGKENFKKLSKEGTISLYIRENFFTSAASTLNPIFGKGQAFGYPCPNDGLIFCESKNSKSKKRDLMKLLDVLPSLYVNIFQEGVSAVSTSSSISQSEIMDLVGATEEFKAHTKQGKALLTFEYQGNKSSKPSLLDDLPLGARILAAAASGYRNKQLQVWKAANELQQRIKIPVRVEVPSLSWSVLDNAKSGRKGNVHLPYHSLQTAAVHKGPENIYAVSGDMLDINGGGARVEDITFLPLGNNWLAMAFICFGLDPPVQHTLTNQQVSEAERFSSRCNELGEDMRPNRNIVQQLYFLFGENPREAFLRTTEKDDNGWFAEQKMSLESPTVWSAPNEDPLAMQALGLPVAFGSKKKLKKPAISPTKTNQAALPEASQKLQSPQQIWMSKSQSMDARITFSAKGSANKNTENRSVSASEMNTHCLEGYATGASVGENQYKMNYESWQKTIQQIIADSPQGSASLTLILQGFLKKQGMQLSKANIEKFTGRKQALPAFICSFSNVQKDETQLKHSTEHCFVLKHGKHNNEPPLELPEPAAQKKKSEEKKKQPLKPIKKEKSEAAEHSTKPVRKKTLSRAQFQDITLAGNEETTDHKDSQEKKPSRNKSNSAQKKAQQKSNEGAQPETERKGALKMTEKSTQLVDTGSEAQTKRKMKASKHPMAKEENTKMSGNVETGTKQTPRQIYQKKK